MLILGISGSPRVAGNTDLILDEALKAAGLNGAEVKLIRISDYHLEPCNACMTCFKTGKCIIPDEGQKLYDEITRSNGVILASPSNSPFETRADATSILSTLISFRRRVAM